MHFTYHSYNQLLELLNERGYSFSNYHDWKDKKKVVILRHDIDYCIDKAVDMARFESELGVRSTYFVLVTSDFYNIFSKNNARNIHKIQTYGHEVGLHFDEVRYPELGIDDLRKKIIDEAKILETVLEKQVRTVSMHRPSKMILDADLTIPGIINSYGKEYFDRFKYLSDSRRRWREPVEQIIQSCQYDRLHILTHAFWYETEEISIQDSIRSFVNMAGKDRYDYLSDNITDLPSIMSPDEVVGGWK